MQQSGCGCYSSNEGAAQALLPFLSALCFSLLFKGHTLLADSDPSHLLSLGPRGRWERVQSLPVVIRAWDRSF